MVGIKENRVKLVPVNVAFKSNLHLVPPDHRHLNDVPRSVHYRLQRHHPSSKKGRVQGHEHSGRDCEAEGHLEREREGEIQAEGGGKKGGNDGEDGGLEEEAAAHSELH